MFRGELTHVPVPMLGEMLPPELRGVDDHRQVPYARPSWSLRIALWISSGVPARLKKISIPEDDEIPPGHVVEQP